MMPLALVMVSCDSIALMSASCDADRTINDTINSLGQHDQNEVQHDSFVHDTILVPALVLHDANDLANGTNALLRSR